MITDPTIVRALAAADLLTDAQATIDALGDDEYAQLIKEGLEQIAERLR